MKGPSACHQSMKSKVFGWSFGRKHKDQKTKTADPNDRQKIRQ